MAIRSRNKATGEGEKSPSKPLRRRINLQTSASTKPRKVAPVGEIGEVIANIKKIDNDLVRTASDEKADLGRIRTGVLSVDLCLGGGFAKGKAAMLVGNYSAGKSTVALLAVAQALRDNPSKFAVYIDIEGTFDRLWAAKLGVDTERLHIVEPDSGEQAVDLTEAFMRANNVCIIVVDSLAMITPIKEMEDSVEQSQMGKQPILIGKFMRKMTATLLRERKRGHYPVLIYLNQFRMKFTLFGDPRTTPGGMSTDYMISQKAILNNKEHKGKVGGHDVVTFNEHTIQITKNKTGGRIKEGKFKLIRDESEGFREGYIDQTKTVLTFAKEAGLYSGGGTKHVVVGIGTFKSHSEIGDYFYKNPDKLYSLNTRILRFYKEKWNIG